MCFNLTFLQIESKDFFFFVLYKTFFLFVQFVQNCQNFCKNSFDIHEFEPDPI